MNKSLTR